MLRKRWVPLMVVYLLIVSALIGCGTKSAGDVVGSLEKKVNNMQSYSAQGTLVLQTGQTPQEYDVEVWYKKPDYYRIALTNRERNITQIVLRNDDGVFVLTPHLNKSFRFQSGWPGNNGQVYLFESLARSIFEDEERKFVNEEDAYTFEVKANYQNRTLAAQKIWLDKENLAPKKVQVMDTDYKVLVELTFMEFKFDLRFDDDAFDMDRNMTGFQLDSLPAISQQQEASTDFWPLEPGYTPEGVALKGMQEVTNEDGRQIIFKYDGTYQYTIIEEQPKEQMVVALSGEPMDLGFAVGVLTQNGDTSTLRFTYDGVDFTLLSSNLPVEEMQQIAMSVFGQIGK